MAPPLSLLLAPRALFVPRAFLAVVEDPGALVNLGVGVAIGLLLGLQRERHFAVTGVKGPAGARTFPIVALLGGLATLAAGGPGGAGFPWLPAAGLLGLGALAATAVRRGPRSDQVVGLTTEVSLLLTYVLGATAVAGRPETAAIVGAGALVLVGLKSRLHGLAGRLTDEDETAAIKFTAIALLVLPFLPNRDFGPYDAINPHDVGLMAVLVAGISFVGYAAAKAIGSERGLLLTGLLGGLVSTTATTAAFARRSRTSPDHSPALAAGAVASNCVLFPRLLVLALVVDRNVAVGLAPYLAAMAGAAVVAAGLGLVALRRATHVDVGLKNPFELAPAVMFAALYGVVVLVAKVAEAWYGSRGLYVAGAVSGTTDVDAITLTAGRLGSAGVPIPVLARTITIAVISNSVVKAGIAIALGSQPYARRVAAALLATAAAGGVAILFL